MMKPQKLALRIGFVGALPPITYAKYDTRTHGSPSDESLKYYHITADSFESEGDFDNEYNDEDGIFPRTENKTSPQVFLESIQREFKKSGKNITFTNEYDQWAGLYYAHRLIKRARRDNTTDLYRLMRNMGYFITPFGMIGNDKSGFNNEIMKPITAQYIPDQITGELKAKIFSPPSRANTYELVEIPIWDDHNCYPDCPECYDDICNTFNTIIFISFGILLILLMLIGGYIWATTNMQIHDIIFKYGYVFYWVFEVLLAFFGIISLYSVRISKDTMSSSTKIILAICLGLDGTFAFIRLNNFLWAQILGFESCADSIINKVRSAIMALAQTCNSVVLLAILSASDNSTSSSIPMFLDLISGFLEVIIFIAGSAFEGYVHQVETTVIRTSGIRSTVVSDVASND